MKSNYAIGVFDGMLEAGYKGAAEMSAWMAGMSFCIDGA
jgi:hypothetical protein